MVKYNTKLHYIGVVIALMMNSKDMLELETLPQGLFIMIFSIAIPATTVNLRLFGNDRMTYARYKDEGISKFAYYIGMSLVGFLNLFFQPLFYLSLFYPMAMPRGSFGEYYILIFLAIFNAQSIAQLVTILTGMFCEFIFGHV